jgi:prephenate dehydratase
MLCSSRLSFANRLAEIKFAANPFGFLQSDPLWLLTDRGVEREITGLFPDPLFLGLIDLSKRIQLRCLRDLCASFRTGYLFGAGSFSGEAVGRLAGVHVAFPDRPALFRALEEGLVDAILLPTYNSLIGSIFTVDTEAMTVRGAIEHPIRLCLYGNRPAVREGGLFVADTLYIEPHVRRECQAFLSSSVKTGIVQEVDSTREGCLWMFRDTGSALTVASEHNASACMVTLAKDIVDHNVTTFSFLMRKTPRRPTFPSIDACIDVHCR